MQTKIIAGYLILLAVIGSMIAILLHERKKMHDIANGTAEIREIRNEVNAIRRHIVGIALLGNPPSDGTARTSQHTRTGACT